MVGSGGQADDVPGSRRAGAGSARNLTPVIDQQRPLGSKERSPVLPFILVLVALAAALVLKGTRV
jgi:hypothetical protein